MLALISFQSIDLSFDTDTIDEVEVAQSGEFSKIGHPSLFLAPNTTPQ